MKMVLAAIAVASFGSAAIAGAPADTSFGKPSTVMTLRGLDLSTADGQRRLATRVDQAGRAVCGDRLSTIHADLEARSRACRADVAEQVRAQIETRVAANAATKPVQVASLR